MCFGPFTKTCHWGPLTALAIIKCVTGMTIHCTSLLWPSTTLAGVANTICFMSLSGLTLYNFLSCIYHGPGYLPLGWLPAKDEDKKKLQWCSVCKGFKAPRSHHCRKCGRCILKMDHHCPWINNCVGWGNHAHFTAFLLFAVLGCFHASVILCSTLFKALYVTHYARQGGPVVRFGLYGFVFCVFSLGLAIGVVVAVGMLLFFQVKSIVNNRTNIEDWILEKAKHRHKNISEEFHYPYDLGCRDNIRQVVTYNCEPVGDGITWPVAANCNQYTLTLEQIAQKHEKRERTKLYKIMRGFSGAWLPVTQGLGVFCHPPCTDEPRIKLEVGDMVVVTRWRKYWLFGEKIQTAQDPALRMRGWFPRKCAMEIHDRDTGNRRSHRDKKYK